jgi:hypothetical protein
MLTLSLAEGFARALDIRRRMSTLSLPKGSSPILSFRRPSPIPFPQRAPLTSIIPTLAHPSVNSNHSRTYGTPGGGYPWSNHSLFNTKWSALSSWLSAGGCQLSAIRSSLTSFPTSLTQKQGGTPLWSYQSRSPLSPLACPERRRRVTRRFPSPVPTPPRRASTYSSSPSTTPIEVTPK